MPSEVRRAISQRDFTDRAKEVTPSNGGVDRGRIVTEINEIKDAAASLCGARATDAKGMI